jgi:hypothetical protein
MEDDAMKKLKRIYSLLLITSSMFTSCMIEDAIKIPFQSYIPSDLADGWEIAKPADEKLNGEALKDI